MEISIEEADVIQQEEKEYPYCNRDEHEESFADWYNRDSFWN